MPKITGTVHGVFYDFSHPKYVTSESHAITGQAALAIELVKEMVRVGSVSVYSAEDIAKTAFDLVEAIANEAQARGMLIETPEYDKAALLARYGIGK